VDVTRPDELAAARVLVFPGVGAFGSAMAFLTEHGFVQPLRDYIASGRHYMGICLGLQTLFESSEESPGLAGLGVIPGAVARFPPSETASVPHIGWNGVRLHQRCAPLAALAEGGGVGAGGGGGKVYFVHSYRAVPSPANAAWVAATTDYGTGAGSSFISAVAHGNVFATQFHPEKSGAAGGGDAAAAIAAAAEAAAAKLTLEPVPLPDGPPPATRTRLARRIVA
jgi:glutamine amidotransferase/cyclase